MTGVARVHAAPEPPRPGSLVFSSAAITGGAGETCTVYSGGTTAAPEGITTGTLEGADGLGTVVAGDYAEAAGPGRR